MDPERGVAARDRPIIGADDAIDEAETVSGLEHTRRDLEPLTDLRRAEEVDREAHRHAAARLAFTALAERLDDRQPRGVVGERADQAAMHEAPAVAVRLARPERQQDRAVRGLRIERLPGVGKRALAGMPGVAFGDVLGRIGHRRPLYGSHMKYILGAGRHRRQASSRAALKAAAWRKRGAARASNSKPIPGISGGRAPPSTSVMSSP